jgi:hypothetical protein
MPWLGFWHVDVLEVCPQLVEHPGPAATQARDISTVQYDTVVMIVYNVTSKRRRLALRQSVSQWL